MNAVILFIADGHFISFRQSESVSIGAFKYLCPVNVHASIMQRESAAYRNSTPPARCADLIWDRQVQIQYFNPIDSASEGIITKVCLKARPPVTDML